MSKSAPKEYPVSQKGWIKLGFDRSIWIPCPPWFPEGMNRKSWASQYSQGWWNRAGLQHGKREERLLAQTLSYIHANTYGKLPCHLALIHLPDPRMAPLLVCFGIWPALGERDSQLRILTHADDPTAMEPPIVESFSTDSLGSGLKVLYHQLLSDGKTVIGNLSYAWRSTQYETDLRLFTSCADLGRLQRAIPDIEQLARVSSIVASAS